MPGKKGGGPPARGPDEGQDSPPTPTPEPTPGDPGEALGPPDASTDALESTTDEEQRYVEENKTTGKELLSATRYNDLPDAYAGTCDGWSSTSPESNPYTSVASAAATMDVFVGHYADAYTGTIPQDANSNAYTGTYNVNVFTGLENTASPALALFDTTQWARAEGEVTARAIRQPVSIVRGDSESVSERDQFVHEIQDPVVSAPEVGVPAATAPTVTGSADTSQWARGEGEPSTPVIPEGQWVKETVIHAEEVHFYAAQSTPPPEPDHSLGYYPFRDADSALTQRYGDDWQSFKSAFVGYGLMRDVTIVFGTLEDIAPYNALDHFRSAGSYANRWVWYSQHGQAGTGLLELLKGHLEASAAVGSVETGGALAKGGISIGATAIAKSKLPLVEPKAYSVALQVELKLGEVPDFVSDAGRRTRHRELGQDFAYRLIDEWNKSLDPEERELGKRMSELLQNSNEWQLHHDPQRPGFLELVPTDQHQAPGYQNLFHPFVGKTTSRTVGRVGGFYVWGRDY